MRILAVDDDDVIRELITHILRTAGYADVTLADGAEEAIDRIKGAARPFDCILLDIQMPRIDGIQLCRSLRRVKGYEKTPIIMLTAMSQKEYVDHAFMAGATDYVTKPFEPRDLLSRIRVAEMLVAERQRADAASREAELVETEPRDFADLVEVSDVPGVVSHFVLQNYISQLSRIRAWRVGAFGVRVPQARRVFLATDATGFADFISELAEVLAEVMAGAGAFISYVGEGTFLVAGQRGTLPEPGLLADALRERINDPEMVYRADPNLHFDVVVGPTVAPGLFDFQNQAEFLRRAVERVDEEARLLMAERRRTEPIRPFRPARPATGRRGSGKREVA